ncbi:MAG: putative manganese-dependent inorganic diphosphatase [Atopobiaceae bacterium]|nr:putative manganese-dependent inorganic diphosphatase [Atopobiaceae bacterium]MBR1829938.1 putative manganese-dependent inorganic diphosphatase [Atopobiaceae bacterium]
MPDAIRKVNVVGHQHPDTDSICAAISYAYLKSQVDPDTEYEARRAGAINRETAFVLQHFGFEEPRLITDASPQIKDTNYNTAPAINGETSLLTAWNLMRDDRTSTLCIADDEGTLQGLIAVKDIANANMDILDSEVVARSHTRFSNIVDTLEGVLIVGDPEGAVCDGHVIVGTSPEMMEDVIEKGDIVLTTNRYETQDYAVRAGAGLLIVCGNARVSAVVREVAEERGCAIIATKFDTYAASRLITMSIPVRAKMLDSDLVDRFSVNTAVEDAQKVVARTGHRFFPVLNEDGTYAGIITSSDMIAPRKKHVILVDHNERSQAVYGLEQAEIMEIIDHHRIGSIETSGPVYFRNMPVGCTCTIIYDIFQENGVEIPANIAGLMLSAILSDTLCFRSPTCTPRDKYVGEQLAKLCGEDPEDYADKMFDAGADLTGRTADEVFNSDFKVFSRGDVRFGVGQGSFMTEASRKAAEELVGPYLKDGAAVNELPMVFYLFTDVKSQASDMLYWGAAAEEVASRAFGVSPVDGVALLPGVVSRKKQVIPALMETLQRMQEEQQE